MGCNLPFLMNSRWICFAKEVVLLCVQLSLHEALRVSRMTDNVSPVAQLKVLQNTGRFPTGKAVNPGQS